MDRKWYLVRQQGGEQYGPFDTPQLRTFIAEGRLIASDRLWHEGMTDWVPASSVSELDFSASLPPNIPPVPDFGPPNASPVVRVSSGDRIAAGLFAILLGYFGIHKFFYGANTAGIIMLLTTVLTCGGGMIVTGPIGVVEGIIYLTRTDEEFEQEYLLGKKAWF